MNRRFFPTSMDVRNHMYKSHSGMSTLADRPRKFGDKNKGMGEREPGRQILLQALLHHR